MSDRAFVKIRVQVTTEGAYLRAECSQAHVPWSANGDPDFVFRQLRVHLEGEHGLPKAVHPSMGEDPS